MDQMETIRLRKNVIFYLCRGGDRIFLGASEYVKMHDDPAMLAENAMTVEVWLWPTQDTLPVENAVFVKIDTPGTNDDIELFFSKDCKCVSLEFNGDTSTAIVSTSVESLVVPAFLGISVWESNGNVNAIVTFQGISVTGQFSAETFSTTDTSVKIGNGFPAYASKADLYYGVKPLSLLNQ